MKSESKKQSEQTVCNKHNIPLSIKLLMSIEQAWVDSYMQYVCILLITLWILNHIFLGMNIVLL